VARSGAGFDVRVSLDETWLVDKTFPIVLDPSYSWAWGRPGWTTNGQVAAYAATVAKDESCGATKETCLAAFDLGNLYAGSVQQTGQNWSAMRSVVAWWYDEPSAHHVYDTPGNAPFNVPQGGKITGAQLWLYHTGCLAGAVNYNDNCGPATTPKPLKVQRLNVAGIGANPTWQSVNNSIVGPVSTTVQADSHGRAFRPMPWYFTGDNSTYLADGTWQFLQIKDIVQSWVDNPSQGAALVIRNNDETVGTKGTSWVSDNTPANTNRRYNPYLRVQWEDTAPGAPRNVTATVTGNNQIKVDWDDPTASSTEGTTWPMGYQLMVRQAETNSNWLSQPVNVSATAAREYTFQNLVPMPVGHYEVLVTAYNNAGAGPGVESNPVTSPGAINLGPIYDATQASATAGDTLAHVTWTTPVLGPLVAYEVQPYKAEGNAPVGQPQYFTDPAASYPTRITRDVIGLQNGTDYYFTVRATTNPGHLLAGTPSVTTAVTPFGKPFEPRMLDATWGNEPGSIDVRWNPPTARTNGTPGDNGNRIMQYEVRVYDKATEAFVKSETYIPPPNTTSESLLSTRVRDCTIGHEYYVTVRAKNAHPDWGPESARSLTVAPAGKPVTASGIFAVPFEGSAYVWWPPSDPNGGRIDTYTVVADPAGPGASLTKEVAGTARSTTVNGLAGGETYTLSVQPVGPVGNGPVSETSDPITILSSSAAPDPVATPTATAGDSSATVSWSPAATHGAMVSSYVVTDTAGNALAETTGGSRRSVVVPNLTNGQTYQFKVIAKSSAGTSGASNPSAGVTPHLPSAPGVPSIFDVAPSSSTSVSVKWKPPAGDAPVGHYEVRSSDGKTKTVNGDVLSTTIGGFSNTDRDIVFTVRAMNNGGASVFSGNSDKVNVGLPDAPSVTSRPGPDTAGISWQPAKEFGIPVDHYDVYSSQLSPSGGRHKVATVDADDTGDFHYSEQTSSLRLEVLPVTDEGTGKVAYLDVFAGTPSAPRNLQVSIDRNMTANLTFDAPANSNGSLITGYAVYETASDEPAYKAGHSVGSIFPSTQYPTNPIKLPGRRPNVTYAYQVVAINDHGEGARTPVGTSIGSVQAPNVDHLWGVDSCAHPSAHLDAVLTRGGQPAFWGQYLGHGSCAGGQSDITFLHERDIPVVMFTPGGKDNTPFVGTTDTETIEKATNQARSNIAKLKEIGFPKNNLATIFLDIEPSRQVNAVYFNTWIAEIRAAGYRPGLYVSSHIHGSAVCASNHTDVPIWNYYPSPGRTKAADAPAFNAGQWPCQVNVAGWQYGQPLSPNCVEPRGDDLGPCTSPSVDTDELLPTAINVLWYP
jgi:hypothetical protein